MAPSPAQSDVTIEQLARRLDVLNERVLHLEKLQGMVPQPAPAPEPELPGPIAPVGHLIPLLGQGLLGLAAAYFLRAMVEMKAVPAGLGAPIGIAYSLAWLSFASRAAEPWTVKIRAMTATAILIPLLWEAQMRFHALPTGITAGVLLLFSVFGLAISWRKNVAAAAWIATLSGALTMCALLVATRDVMPFLWALLGLAAVVEASACLDHWLTERWLIALLVDGAVALVTWLVTQPRGLPEEYVRVSATSIIAAQIALLVLYVAATIVRTLGRGRRILPFDVAQCVAALAIAVSGAYRVANGHPAMLAVLAGFCATCALACYTVALMFQSRGDDDRRNLAVYSTFGLALAATCALLIANGAVLAGAGAVLAIAAALGGSKTRLVGWHSAAYLLLAAGAAGLSFAIPAHFLRATGATGPPQMAAFLVVGAAGYCAWLFCRRRDATSRPWFLIVLTGIFALSLATLLADAGFRAPAGYRPFLYTAILTLGAVALALASRKLDVAQLAWTAYGLLALATVKLVVQDLPSGHMLAIVGSLVLYGGTLILLPRLRAG